MSRMNVKRVLFATAAAGTLSLALGPSPANALPVSSFIENGANAASDEDREYLIDRNYNPLCDSGPCVTGAPKGQLDVGDSLRGMFSFNTLNSSGANLGGTTPNNEWTGLFQSRITFKSVTPDAGADGILGNADDDSVTIFRFGPDPAFATSICGGVASCVPGLSPVVPGAGAMFVFYDDSLKDVAQDFDDPPPAIPVAGCDDGTTQCPPALPPSFEDVSTGLSVTEELFIQTARNGTHFWTLGFTGPVDGGGFVTPGPGEGWRYSNVGPFTDNIIAAFFFGQGTSGGTANTCLSVLDQGAASAGIDVLKTTPCLLGGLADVTLSITVRGVANLLTPFEASSNANLDFEARVPEPATLSLFGLGLFGLGFMYKRRMYRRRDKKQTA